MFIYLFIYFSFDYHFQSFNGVLLSSVRALHAVIKFLRLGSFTLPFNYDLCTPIQQLEYRCQQVQY